VILGGNETLAGNGTIILGRSVYNEMYEIDNSGTQTVTIGAGITIHAAGGSLDGYSSINSHLINQGFIGANTAGGVGLGFHAVAVINNGTVAASNGEGINMDEAPLSNAGTITVGVGSQITNNNQFQQTSGGTLSLDVGGTAPGQYGTFNVPFAPFEPGTGVATLAGTLNVAIVNGYNPQVGDSIPIITFGSASGKFTTVNVTGLPTGLAVTPVYNATNVTLVVGQALMASSTASATASQVVLTAAELAPVVTAAVDRWAGAGATPAEIARLQQMHFVISNLPTGELGMEEGNTIWIDQNADGWGWFLPATMQSDRAFFGPVGGELVASRNSAAFGKMDLLTVVEHELGHALGLDDLPPGSGPDTLMSEYLSPGVRLLPDAALTSLASYNAAADAYFAWLGKSKRG
jgi:hypothetical protein